MVEEKKEPSIYDEDILPRTKKILDLALQKQEDLVDSPFMVSGKENWGKSDLILNCIAYLDRERGEDTPIDNVARNLYELAQAMARVKKKGVLALDEGKELDAKATMKGESLVIENTFTVIRKTAHILFIAFTNPLKIQRYYKEDRVRGVFLCRKPYVYYYSDNQLRSILGTLKKSQNLSINDFLKFTPRFKEYYPRYVGKLRDEYDKRKDINIDLKLQEMINLMGKKRESVSMNKASKMLHMSPESIKDLVDNGELYAEKTNNGRWLIPLDEIQRFMPESVVD